jgi:antitoxin ParD1/3/4
MTDQPFRLAKHFEVFIEDQVSKQRFLDATAVVEEGLRLLEAREARHEALVRALKEGEESGPATPFEMSSWLDEQDRADL